MMKYYDFNSTTDIEYVGSAVENKFLGDTLDYLVISTRTSIFTGKFTGYVYLGDSQLDSIANYPDNYGKLKQYTPFDFSYNTLTGLYETTLIDPTRILDEITIDGIAMTNQTTQLAGFLHLYNKIMCRITGVTNNLPITFPNSGYEVLDDTKACQELIMDGVHTIREVFDYYLSTWDLSIRAKFGASSLELYVVSPNKTGSSISSFNNYKESSKGENITNAIVTNAKNLVLNNAVREKGLGLTSDVVPLDSDSAYIETLYNIYSIDNALAYMNSSNLSVRAGGYDQNQDYIYTNNYSYSGYQTPVDIGGQVVDKEIYDSLSTNERVSTMYYTRGSKKIEHVSTLDSDIANGYTKATVLERAINNVVSAINTSISQTTLDDNSDEVKAWWSHLPSSWQTALRSDVESNGTYIDYDTYETIGFKIYSISVSVDSNTWKTTKYDLNYVTRDDFHVRKGYDGFSIIDNQNNGTLDEKRFMNSLDYKLERMNNAEMEVSTNSNIYNVGDHYYNYVVDKIQIAYNGLNQQCHYHLQNNYNAYGERTDVNRELRLYAIPTDRYVRAVFERTISSTLFNADGVLVSATAVKSSGDVSYSNIYVPLIKVGDCKILRFKDNYAIRNFLTTDTVGILGLSVPVSEPLRYCDENGRLTSITLKFVTYQADDTNFPNNNNCTTIAAKTYVINKDAFEQVEFSFNK